MTGYLKKIFSGWMESDRIDRITHYALYFLSVIYGMAVRIRLFLYSKGIIAVRRLPCRVISIGNIAVGGSGKTPMAMFISRYLENKGFKTAIISRGYSGSLKGRMGVVSDGSRVLLTAREVGDEPYLMAKRLKKVPVIVGANRYRAGIYALRRFNPAYIILDDGFQHIRLERDLNVLVVDSARGFGNNFLLPRGLLREPLSEIRRADIILVKENGGKNINLDDMPPPLTFRYRPVWLESLDGRRRLAIDSLEGKRVAAVAGIANPDAFIKTVKDAGADVVLKFIFPDHHWYTVKDAETMKRRIREAGDDIGMVVTTEKDMMRLRCLPPFGFDIYMVGIELVIDDMASFERLLTPFIKNE